MYEGTTVCIQELIHIKSFTSVSEIRLGSALAPRPVSLCDVSTIARMWHCFADPPPYHPLTLMKNIICGMYII